MLSALVHALEFDVSKQATRTHMRVWQLEVSKDLKGALNRIKTQIDNTKKTATASSTSKGP